MEQFYAGKLPPILCTSICATAAMFVSRSRESRVLSVQWAKEVDAYIFGNLNVFKVLNIQLLILSMFQNFAYRQFGKMWLLISMAARLAVSFQLNDEKPASDNETTAALIKRECERRLVWHVWSMDKMLSAGLAAVSKAVTTMIDLRDRLGLFLKNTPKHLQLSELNMFSHSTTSEFSSYLTLNSWYLQCACDLFRVALPAAYRESASPKFLASAPPDFVSEWCALAVSHALRQARLWEHLQNLRAKGALQSKQTRIPLRLGYGSMVHQCTKTLLTARRCKLYDDLVDPITGEAAELNDEAVEALCQSNIALLDDMAKIAPIIAVLQQDVEKMVEADKDRRQNQAETQELAPVSSEVQRNNLLSRYHPLSQSFDSNAKTADEVALQHADPPQPPSILQTSETTDLTMTDSVDIYPASLASAAGLNDIGSGLDGPLTWSGFAENQLAPDYFVAPSQFDMSGELSWFLSGYMDPDPASV
ncbi:hypothetical protein CSAL01_08449 [Colletotrichum salicis]|uniref:Xylanolytic transcriptional activator regulatory domain-containing protein n=1 Tax=Colletotrichum salicis TaxID=1209931 RepID=A0A135V7V3_9PEZI|nr:hypothetical protein CSAL01_08449 [Colletotrichum salicis]